MSTTLNIPVSEELLTTLRHQAEKEGKTVENLAVEYLQRRAGHPRRSHFLEKWAGKIDTGIPDLSLNVDEYLGKAHLETNDESHEP